MVSHNEVIRNFFNAGDREYYNKGANVFFEDNTLYSYGHHFILAQECKNGYILNGDGYSVSTSKHQSYTRRHAPSDSPIIPFSALESLFKSRTKKYNPSTIEELKQIEIIDITEDTYTTVTRQDKNGDPYEAKVHHLGASLFKYKNKYYISSIDATGKSYNTFFICTLQGRPETVEEAFRDMAQNLTDKEYKGYLEGKIKRQGEYFLIPDNTPILEARIKPFIKHKKNLSKTGNAHIARDYVKIDKDTILIRGTLRHREHKMICMGNVWHKVIKNTAKRSWSASGNVD